MSNPIKEEHKELLEFFNKYDRNGDGAIDKDELSQLLTEILEHAGIQVTEKRLEHYSYIFDINSDMSTSLDEFTMLLEKYDNPIKRG